MEPGTLFIRELTEEEKKRINANFTYHPAKKDQVDRYEAVRVLARTIAVDLSRMCPPSRELSLALTNLEQAVFWANAAIARNEPEEPKT